MRWNTLPETNSTPLFMPKSISSSNDWFSDAFWGSTILKLEEKTVVDWLIVQTLIASCFFGNGGGGRIFPHHFLNGKTSIQNHFYQLLCVCVFFLGWPFIPPQKMEIHTELILPTPISPTKKTSTQLNPKTTPESIHHRISLKSSFYPTKSPGNKSLNFSGFL